MAVQGTHSTDMVRWVTVESNASRKTFETLTQHNVVTFVASLHPHDYVKKHSCMRRVHAMKNGTQDRGAYLHYHLLKRFLWPK